jgi:hypothetical protein
MQKKQCPVCKKDKYNVSLNKKTNKIYCQDCAHKDPLTHEECGGCHALNWVAGTSSEGKPLCYDCYNKSDKRVAECCECHTDKPIHTYIKKEPICKKCNNRRLRAKKNRVCCYCKKKTKVKSWTKNNRPVCYYCDKKLSHKPIPMKKSPPVICVRCENQRKPFRRTSRGVVCRHCYHLYYQKKRKCSRCGNRRIVNAYINDLPVCLGCYQDDPQKHEICCRCHMSRSVCTRTKDGLPICRSCSKEKCSSCGKKRYVFERTPDDKPICKKCAKDGKPATTSIVQKPKREKPKKKNETIKLIKPGICCICDDFRKKIYRMLKDGRGVCRECSETLIRKQIEAAKKRLEEKKIAQSREDFLKHRKES